MKKAAAAFAVLAAVALAPLAGTLLREREDRRAAAPKDGVFVQTGGAEVFVQETGPAGAPVLLFTHGMGAWSGLWRPLLSGVPGVRCVLVDLPPFGYSGPAANGDYSRAAQGRRLWGVLDALGVKRASLVGHSFGSGAIVEAAMLHPERVERLVLLAPALSVGEGGRKVGPPWFLRGPLARLAVSATLANPLMTRRGLAGFMARKEAATDERVAILRRPMRSKGYAAGLAKWLPYFVSGADDGDSFRLEAYTALDSKLAAPALLLYGDKDDTTPLSQGERLKSVMPRARLEVLKGVGHMPQLEDPGQTVPLLLRRD